ncbi:MAG: hypothetical protein OIF48_11975 [Silicimonas sp.]|nr:hypothetical protein [Silicimonas sp.]
MTETELIVHVHVPKTAGTSINAALQKSLGPGRKHVEQIIDDPDAFEAAVGESLWIAGHVATPRMRTAVARLGRPARYITALRDPVSHVASHYNWLIEIGHRGAGFLNGHPPGIRALHARISANDNGNPHAIRDILIQHSGLFMNAQAKHVIGPGFSDPEMPYRDVLEGFFDVFLQGHGETRLTEAFPGFVLEKENVARSHFDREVFRDPVLTDFLMDRNRLDHALWSIAKTCPPKARDRQP